MKNFKPDSIIALGGGSVIDAAKCIWLFYGDDNLSFDKFRLKFMDIEKKAFKFPKIDKIKFIAIPTTSGTGSEVTSFTVITDNVDNKEIKYPIADYCLTPDVAIIDSQFVESLPPIIIADTGMDVLTHAIEAYVSTMANDFTDGLCIQAIKIVFEHLKSSYESKSLISKEKMHNASCIAGMAFSNAFLGVCHSMAHKLGGEFNISHGRANAVLLPYIIKYNSSYPSKLVSFPKYENFIADIKYEQISNILGISGKTKSISINNLKEKIINLNNSLNIPKTIKDLGIKEKDFLNKIDNLSYMAHDDQCTGTNPRYPLISEIKQIYLDCFYGNL